MKADTLDLAALFSKSVQYQVPLFQRPYVWTQDDHWDPLWGDVVSLLEDNRNGETHEHFMGAVVLEQIPTTTARVEKRHVIDGQQRLTTLQLLLAAVRDEASARGMENQVAFVGSMVENPAYVIQDQSDKWKVLPTRSDQLGFIAAMTPEREDTRLEAGHDFFRSVIAEWLDQSDTEGQVTEFERLVQVLTRSLKLVVIDLDGSDQAQVIFETLNARGTPLEAADLVKNALFDRARREGHDLERLHDEVWSRFLDDYWREEVRQGRLIRSRIDVFVTHYLTMKTGVEIKSSQLFNRYREWMNKSDSDARTLMEDLERYGGIFAGFGDAGALEPERRFFENLSIMDTSTLYPFLLWLYGEPTVTPSDRIQILVALESFLIRRMLLRVSNRNYNRFFLALLGRVSRTPQDARRATISFLSDSDADTARWPSDEELVDRLPSLKTYGNIRRDRLQMVLEAISGQHFSSRYQEPIRISGDLTIEHLMPQRWEAHWESDGTLDVREERNNLVHTIGNLTIITQALNSKLSNGPWGAKLESILEHSALPINRGLPATWNEEAIRNRSTELARAICAVWRTPDVMLDVQAAPSSSTVEAGDSALTTPPPMPAGLEQPGPPEFKPEPPHPTVEVRRPPTAAVPEHPGAASPQTARATVLAAFEKLERDTGDTVFELIDIIHIALDISPQYEESTIRTHITSVMCSGAPEHHANTTDDLRRLGRGLYQRIEGAEPSRSAGRRKWDQEAFFEEYARSCGDSEAQLVLRVIEFCADNGFELKWGSGKKNGSLSPKLRHGGSKYPTFSLWTDGTVQVQFSSMKVQPFATPDQRATLARRLEVVPGLAFTDSDIATKWASFRADVIGNAAALEAFLSAWRWYAGKIRSTDEVVEIEIGRPD